MKVATRTLFQPYLTVWADGRVEIDFTDCQVENQDDDGFTAEFDTDDGYDPTAKLLDSIITPAPFKGTSKEQADALRRLADYIESSEVTP